MIQFADPKAENAIFSDKITRSIDIVIKDSNYILGHHVKSFEKNLAKFCNTNYALGVANGTDALFLSLKALGVGPGDEVITTCHTALATIAAITATGAKAVVIDIENDMLMANRLLKKAITRKTKAIIAVHLYGLACDMHFISALSKAHKLFVIEDCAQAFGTKYKGRPVGSLSDLATFSFYPTKNLGAIGDGGAIVTNSAQLFYKISLLHQYGWDKSRVSQCPGYNSRLDEIQAAILDIKLHSFSTLLDMRRKLAMAYLNELIQIDDIVLPTDSNLSQHSYHLFVIKTKNRDRLKEYLYDNGIAAGIHYPELVTAHPGYQGLIKYKDKDLVTAKQTINEILSLPLYPGLKSNDQIKIIKAIKGFFYQELKEKRLLCT
ncbi:MAG: DegT/DnrJ/EryC1/StrS family aminotransferase [Francisellaceae bacterium]|jgi:dTDP-4-amino-4,6-dideoxygalactose transaminase|nr:DegT/DnrJ/EryC1/StrS family aminotransferase [Francisellaceae bacterium]